jgi:hypothetical protein
MFGLKTVAIVFALAVVQIIQFVKRRKTPPKSVTINYGGNKVGVSENQFASKSFNKNDH